MMISPYDWQEGVSQRAQYIENRLRGGSPIVALSISSGSLIYTYRKHVRKIYEVYDRLMFSAMGQQADVEALRLAAVDFAHQEGYARSETDVTIGRVVGFALSSPLRRAFGDITTAPLVVQALFAEMGDSPERDLYFTLRYDGDFEVKRNFAVCGGTSEVEERMLAELELRYDQNLKWDDAIKLANEIWKIGADVDGNGEPDPLLLSDAHSECGLLDRESTSERSFKLIEGERT